MGKRKRPAPKSGRTPQDHHGAPYTIDAKDIPVAIEMIRGFAAIGATTKEIAHALRISEPTLFNFFERVPAARKAWEDAREGDFKLSLRRKQFRLASKSATMAIFLGMNELGQKDMRHQTGNVQHDHRFGDLLSAIEEVARAERARLLGHEPKAIEHNPQEIAA